MKYGEGISSLVCMERKAPLNRFIIKQSSCSMVQPACLWYFHQFEPVETLRFILTQIDFWLFPRSNEYRKIAWSSKTELKMIFIAVRSVQRFTLVGRENRLLLHIEIVGETIHCTVYVSWWSQFYFIMHFTNVPLRSLTMMRSEKTMFSSFVTELYVKMSEEVITKFECFSLTTLHSEQFCLQWNTSIRYLRNVVDVFFSFENFSSVKVRTCSDINLSVS